MIYNPLDTFDRDSILRAIEWIPAPTQPIEQKHDVHPTTITQEQNKVKSADTQKRRKWNNFSSKL
jgi:hypothetical protein